MSEASVQGTALWGAGERSTVGGSAAVGTAPALAEGAARTGDTFKLVSGEPANDTRRDRVRDATEKEDAVRDGRR